MKQTLVVNENSPHPALYRLRGAGVDVIVARELMPGASDEAILRKIRETNRWLVTFDRDYGELVYSKHCPAPPAILYPRQEPCPADKPTSWMISLLGDPMQANSQFIVIDKHTIRYRPLPAKVP